MPKNRLLPGKNKTYREYQIGFYQARSQDEYTFYYLIHDSELLKVVRQNYLTIITREFWLKGFELGKERNKQETQQFKTLLYERELVIMEKFLDRMMGNGVIDPEYGYEYMEVRKYRSYLFIKLGHPQESEPLTTNSQHKETEHLPVVFSSCKLKLSNKKNIRTDLIRLLDALYDLQWFEKEDEQLPNKGEFMKSFGEFSKTDLSNYHTYLYQARQAKINTYLETFEKLKKVAIKRYGSDH